MNENQLEAFGKNIIETLGLKVKRNGRVDTSWGDKTPIGLARTILRMEEEAQK